MKTFRLLLVLWRSLRYLLILLVTITGIVACDRPNPPDPIAPPPASSCQTIHHFAGSSEVCTPVEIIAVLSPPLLDILLTLGEQPSAYAGVDVLNRPFFDRPEQQISYLGNFVSTQPVNLGDRQTPSAETLLTLKPDLILGEPYPDSTYRLLTTIAPTVLLEIQGSEGWQAAIKTVAGILDKEAQGQQAIAAYQKQVDTAKQALTVLSTQPTIVVLGWNRMTQQSFIFDAEDFICEILKDLGFQVIAGQSGRPNLSIEALSQMDTDYILVMPSGDNTIENAKQQWQSNPILQAIPAVQAGNLYFMDYQLTRIRGPIAAEIFLREFTSLLSQN